MHPLVNLAKSSVENYLKNGQIISPLNDVPEKFLNKKAGVFVTIEKQGNLRGCIGTCLPAKENIAEEVIANAIAAAVRDYRFSPINKEELPGLSYTVYILNPPELAMDIKTPAEFSEKNFREQD
jgi:AmmeMemoRadiSam system protein A